MSKSYPLGDYQTDLEAAQAKEYEALVDECARAVAEADTEGLWDRICEREPFPKFWEGSLVTKDDFRKAARAVLAKIVEKAKEWPTEGMVAAHWRVTGFARSEETAASTHARMQWRAQVLASPLVKPKS